jgi:hypothetical protein
MYECFAPGYCFGFLDNFSAGAINGMALFSGVETPCYRYFTPTEFLVGVDSVNCIKTYVFS